MPTRILSALNALGKNKTVNSRVEESPDWPEDLITENRNFVLITDNTQRHCHHYRVILHLTYRTFSFVQALVHHNTPYTHTYTGIQCRLAVVHESIPNCWSVISMARALFTPMFQLRSRTQLYLPASRATDATDRQAPCQYDCSYESTIRTSLTSTDVAKWNRGISSPFDWRLYIIHILIYDVKHRYHTNKFMDITLQAAFAINTGAITKCVCSFIFIQTPDMTMHNRRNNYICPTIFLVDSIYLPIKSISYAYYYRYL